ncbi:lipopolysaccharide biosynthesis protein [Pseudokineococcus lusitanus]|uniref:PST family polysaccharide transporter n=1 Tax=Pseudokineococcus lusitanus TaxID=763993 RepID=A0A3N1G935_9ACTN|nr:lipopolysaccharide biosynthesis protein [Pseudokineococcus lusitanus]ROP26755.1 PST family polysaccharide transporter [Pseudokineococcus lusitanus]
MGSLAIQTAAGLVLARLLFPADFGLLASVYVVTGLTVLFFDLGLSGALVRSRNLTEELKATAFWLNALGGLVFLGLLTALGPLVAGFYGDDRLRWLLPLAGLPFAVGLQVVHSALLQRRFAFRALASTELVAAVVGNTLAIVAAAGGAGYFALVVGPPVQALLLTAMQWRLVRWRPRSFIRIAAVRELWGFSGGLLGYAVVDYGVRSLDVLLLGRFYGPTDVGLYNRAHSLMVLPVQQLNSVLGRVMLPTLSGLGDDLRRVGSAYLQAMRLTLFVALPTLVGMAATAPALINTLWGPRWLDSTVAFQLLCLAGAARVLTGGTGWIYQSQNRTPLMFRMGVLTGVVVAAGTVIGLPHGLVGVAAGVTVATWLTVPFNLLVPSRLVGLPAMAVLRSNAATMLCTALMGVCVWAVPVVSPLRETAVLTLLLQVLAGLLVYAAMGLLLQRPLLRQLVSLLRRRRRR